MDAQRLRNLTTGILHTNVEDIYEDLGTLTGDPGIMTHMIPRVMKAVKPWLQKHVEDKRFWDGKCDTTHVGEYKLPSPTEEEQAEMVESFKAQAKPLIGKGTIVVVVLLFIALLPSIAIAQTQTAGGALPGQTLFVPTQGEASDAYHDAKEHAVDGLFLWTESVSQRNEFMENAENGDYGQLVIQTALQLVQDVETTKTALTPIAETAETLHERSQASGSTQASWTACFSYSMWTFFPAAEAYYDAVSAFLLYIDTFLGED